MPNLKYPMENPADDIRTFKSNGGVVIGVDVSSQRDFAYLEGAMSEHMQDDLVKHEIGRLSNVLRKRVAGIESYTFDHPSFERNGGTLPRHCEKSTNGWLKIDETMGGYIRTIPMTRNGVKFGNTNGDGELRAYPPTEAAREVLDENVMLLFEHEDGSLLTNPNADKMIERIVERAGGKNDVLFAIYGYHAIADTIKDLRKRKYRVALAQDAFSTEDNDAALEIAAHKKVHLVNAADLLSEETPS